MMVLLQSRAGAAARDTLQLQPVTVGKRRRISPMLCDLCDGQRHVVVGVWQVDSRIES